VDHNGDFISFVASGIGEWLHPGWSHSHPAGHRHRCGAGPGYSGAKTLVGVSTLAEEGEGFGEEVVGRPERVYRIYEPFSRKGLVIKLIKTNQQKGVAAMKKRTILIGCLVLMMLIASLVACASTSQQSGTGEYVDDSVITTKVKSLLAADDFLKSFEIGVETYKATVQLSGFVDSQKAIDKAGEIARSVKGVKSVKNNLNVKK